MTGRTRRRAGLRLEIQPGTPTDRRLDICSWCNQWYDHPRRSYCTCGHGKYISLTIHTTLPDRRPDRDE